MMGRNRRGSRHFSTKAKLAIASAVLVGGGAIGAVAVATSGSPAPSAAQSAGFTLRFHHQMSEGAALSAALTEWGNSQRSQQTAMNTLTSMVPMKSFSTARHGHTVFAAQRGVVALATKHWILVKSANGSLHLWLITGQTKVKNVAGSTTGTTAMTGSPAAASAAGQGNMAPASSTMAGSTSTVSALNNPAPQSTSFTVSIGGTNETITITITRNSATVAPTTPQVPAQVTQQTGMSGTQLTSMRQPTFMATSHIARGDLVFVAGVQKHGFLWAQLVLFSAPKTPVVTPSATPSATATVMPSATATVKPTGTATPTVMPTTSTASPTTPPSFTGGKS